MTSLDWLCRVYRLLLRAYPAEFRERYADEMARVFRDRAREIVQSGGARGLLGYTLSTGRDWFVTVLRERMDAVKMPSVSMVRWVFLFCVALDLVLLTRPASVATHYATLPFALLVMYGLLVLLVTTNLDDRRRVALQTGTSWGLISGVILTAWTIGGYFVRSDGIIPVFLALSSMVVIFACWSVAGYRAARRTETTSSGWLAGCWSGVACVLVKVTWALLILKPLVSSENFGMILIASGQHLLEGPVIGAMLGAIAGVAARIFGKWQSSLPAAGLAGEKSPRQVPGIRKIIQEWAVTILLFLFVTTSVVQAYVVPTGSMENNILVGDHMLVDKIGFENGGNNWASYVLPHREVKRGDIIAFRYPEDVRQTYVKRVIGVPGDRIRLLDKQVIRNGKKLDEPYVRHSSPGVDDYRDNFPTAPQFYTTGRGRDMFARNVQDGEVIVPAGMLFVLGDNRDISEDSRYWGFVPSDYVTGKPLVIYWSFDALTGDYIEWNFRHVKDVALHFFTKTRWERTLRTP